MHLKFISDKGKEINMEVVKVSIERSSSTDNFHVDFVYFSSYQDKPCFDQESVYNVRNVRVNGVKAFSESAD